jgi:hypothetical protein
LARVFENAAAAAKVDCRWRTLETVTSG